MTRQEYHSMKESPFQTRDHSSIDSISHKMHSTSFDEEEDLPPWNESNHEPDSTVSVNVQSNSRGKS